MSGYANECNDILKNKKLSLAIISSKIKYSTDLIYRILKIRLDDGDSVKSVNFIDLYSKISDRFGQLDFKILDNFKNRNLISITGLKKYQKIYDRFYPTLASIIDDILTSSIFDRKIILGIEMKSDDLDNLYELFGYEIVDVINDYFEIYSIVGNIE